MNEVWHARSGIVARVGARVVESGPGGEDLAADTWQRLEALPPGSVQHVLQSEGAGPGWVLLLAQLPASPSGPRVALWRLARAAGAAGL
jgi:hypothetical protein